MTRYTPLWIQPGVYPANADRALLHALWPAGATNGAEIVAAPNGGLTGNNVRISPFTVAVPTPNGQSTSVCVSDADFTLLLPAAPQSAANSRYDLIVVRPNPTELGGPGPAIDFDIIVVSGPEIPSNINAGQPAAPPGTLALYAIFRAGGSSSLAGAYIRDMRPGFMRTDFGGVETWNHDLYDATSGAWVPSITTGWWGSTQWNVKYFAIPAVPWPTKVMYFLHCNLRAETSGVLTRTGFVWQFFNTWGPDPVTEDYSLDYTASYNDFRSVNRQWAAYVPPNSALNINILVGIEPNWPWYATWHNWRNIVMRMKAI